MTLRSFARVRAVLSAAVLALCVTQLPASDLDLKIANGRVLDGSGNTWFFADIGVRDGKIVEVGDLRAREADRIIDADGLIVAPGFIDVHTHADSGIFDQPDVPNFIRNGVTTIVSGNCGGSVLNVDTYLSRVERDGIALNVSTLVGHNSVIREQKGNIAEPLTPEQLDNARARVRQAMEEGAVGMSTGLIYLPGRWSETEEIIELQKVVAEHGGIYATHMRSEGAAILNAIDEAIRVADETGSRVQISHFKLPTDMEQRIGLNLTIDKVMEARARGLEIWVDQYPYAASSTGITTLFPGWVLEKGEETAREILQDEEQLKTVREQMASGLASRNREDYSYAQVASARGFPEYSGKTIREIANYRRPESQQTSPAVEDQVDTIVEIYLKGGASMVYHTMSEISVETIMRSPLVAIASDSGVRRLGEGVPHPRGYGTNARVLGQYVRERGIITLEDAIRKMTSMPARAFRFEDRGMIGPGYWADIVIFDPNTVTDNASYEDPHHFSTGFAWVLVNGVPVVENDEVTGERPGQAIRGPGWNAAASTESGD